MIIHISELGEEVKRISRYLKITAERRNELLVCTKSQKYISLHLKILQPNVSRSIRKLRKYGYIKVVKDGRKNSYLILF